MFSQAASQFLILLFLNAKLHKVAIEIEMKNLLLFPVILIFKCTLNVNGATSSVSTSGSLDEWWNQVSTSYPKYENTTRILHEMQKKYPNLVKVYTIGQSVEEREMWVINLRTNVSSPRPLLTPQVKIVANIHGDETVGRALVLMLAVDLIRSFQNGDQRAIRLLNKTDIHLLPSINPDGFESLEGDSNCFPDRWVIGRLNANEVDLNKDFELSLGILESHIFLQPETRNMMEFIEKNSFVLSAALFAQNMIITYPWDIRKKRNFDSINKDFFLYLGEMYVKNHRTMPTFDSWCNQNNNGTLVTQGETWRDSQRVVPRGETMMDYNYAHGCRELSIYLSCCKFPHASTLAIEWDNNRESLYKFLESAHLGVKGIVMDTKNGNKSLENAMVIVPRPNYNYNHKGALTNSRGEYWLPMRPGNYTYIVYEVDERNPRSTTPTEWYGGVTNGTIENPLIVNFWVEPHPGYWVVFKENLIESPFRTSIATTVATVLIGCCVWALASCCYELAKSDY